MASSARKAFWLLKSFNHVGTVITMIETYSLANDECYANLLDILEQLFLIIYYFYENLVFIARTKLVSFTEDSIDDWGNMSWFLEDFICFLAALMRTYISARKLRGYEILDPPPLCEKPGAAVQRSQSRSLELQTKFSDSVLSLAIVSAAAAIHVQRSTRSSHQFVVTGYAGAGRVRRGDRPVPHYHGHGHRGHGNGAVWGRFLRAHPVRSRAWGRASRGS